MNDLPRRGHHHTHAFRDFHPLEREGLTFLSRRNMLKASLAGLAGLSLPELMRRRAHAASTGQNTTDGKSVILLWMAGGPSHIDTWDPKPDRPLENRGPFGTTRHQAAGRTHLRAFAAHGWHARPLHPHSLRRCPPQQSRAEHGLSDRQHRGGPAHQSARPDCIRPSARSSPRSRA